MKQGVNGFKLFALIAGLIALVAALLCVPPAFADELYGRIRGTVTDPSGAVVPGAVVKIANLGTGAVKHATTDQSGSYEIPNLPIGNYSVAVSKDGFRTSVLGNLKLEVNQVYVNNVALQLGATAEAVEVTANPAQVEQSSMQLTADISAKTITDLPLNGRNWVVLQQTLPGVVLPDTRFNTNYSTNGSQAQQNSYLMNGGDFNDLPLNSPLAPPNPDTIAEVKMVTINPEFGRNSGAIMNAITKSGSNSFHGTGFEFYRDTFLNTKAYFQKKPAVFHQNQYGGTIGGPIWKNHTFFFFGLQNTRARQPGANSNGTTNVYTQAMLSGTWNPAKMSATHKIPFAMTGSSGQPCVAGVDTFATCFPTGVVPTSNYNSLAAQLVKQFVPLPNCGTGACTLYSFQPLTTLKTNQYIGRIDQNFGSKDTLWFYAYANDQHTLNDIAFSAASLPGFGDKSAPYTKQFTTAWTHTFTTSILNEFRVGYTRLNFDTGTPQKLVTPSSVGFTNIFPQIPQGAGYPRMTVTGYFNLGFTSNGPQPRKDQTYQLTDNFSWIKGRHSFKMGYDGRRFQVWNPFGARNNGSFAFSNSAKFGSGDPGLNFLLGIPTSYNQQSGQVIIAQAYEHYAYFQDQWRVKDNLTLTYGAGYQIDTPLAEYQNHGLSRACISPGVQSKVFPVGIAPDGSPAGAPLGYLFPGDPGCDIRGGVSTKFNHVGPRVGFAYSPGGDNRWIGRAGKTSIRGGFGMYFNRSEEELNLQDLGSPPIGQNSNGVGDIGLVPAFPNPWTDVAGRGSLANKFPYVAPPPGSLIDFSIYYPMGISVNDHNLSTPYSMNYNLTIERELPGRTILRVGYVGSKAYNLISSYSFNSTTPAGVQACLTDPKNGTGKGCSDNPDSQPVLFPSHYPLPGDVFGNSGMQHSNGWSNYNSLQITADKRVSHGLEFLASYTWSHSLDTSSSFEDTSFQLAGAYDPYGRLSRDYGSSAFDARNRFALTFSYEIPSLHHVYSAIPGRLVEGWRLVGQTILQSGFPINFEDSNELSLTCSTSFSFYACPDRPDIVSTPHALNPRTSANHLWFAPASFTDNALGTLGNTPRGYFRGPGYWGSNFSIQKDTAITERTTFEMRLEAFNVFNHANFANPDADVASSTFGNVLSLRPFLVTAGESSRLVQLGAKFIF
jgi:hypothetical protein